MLEQMNVQEGGEIALCDVCSSAARQYKCPRCGTFTCSLKCCNTHKANTSCSGIRDRAEFVSTRNFKESNLKSDYHFLEDILQTKERAKRTLDKSCGGETKKAAPSKKGKATASAQDIPLILSDTYQRLDSYSKGVKNLFNAAKERNTKLVLMPNGMTKRTLNKTTFNAKENVIYWKVFVVFILNGNYSPDSLFRVDLESSKPTQKLTFAQEALIGVSVDGVSEKRTIDSIFEQFMQPTVENASHRHALRSLRLNKANVRCLMHRIPSPTSNPLFIEVDSSASMKDALAGQTIIEYPTLYFGSFEHTDRLNTLIGSAEDNDTADMAPTKKSIAVLHGQTNAQVAEEEEGEIIESVMEVDALQLHSPSTAALKSHTGGSAPAPSASTGNKVVAFSKDLLCLEYGTDDEDDGGEKDVADIVPMVVEKAKKVDFAAPGRINSSNVADIVGSMKQFIDSTLVTPLEVPVSPADAAAALFAPRPGSSVTAVASSTTSSGAEAGAQHIAQASASSVSAAPFLQDAAGAVDVLDVEGIAEEIGEDGNEEFLAALKDLAGKDIEALKAIIAAAEMEEDEDEDEDEEEEDDDGEEEGRESSEDSSDEDGSSGCGEVAAEES